MSIISGTTARWGQQHGFLQKPLQFELYTKNKYNLIRKVESYFDERNAGESYRLYYFWVIFLIFLAAFPSHAIIYKFNHVKIIFFCPAIQLVAHS